MESVVVDAGFLVALINRRDAHHRWAASMAARYPPPWTTCESALSEAFHLLGPTGTGALAMLLRRRSLTVAFDLASHLEPVLALMEKYKDLPAGLADASIVRMTEVLAEPRVLTTDGDFSMYRRHGRQAIPCERPRMPTR
jgi:predicted nucleic acid-binding protein